MEGLLSLPLQLRDEVREDILFLTAFPQLLLVSHSIYINFS